MEIYIDIETLRSSEQHRMSIIDGVKENFKAPSNLTKTQAAKDLGLDPKSDEVKYTAATDMIKRWETELAEEKSADVAQEKWEKTSFNPDVASIACICIGWFENDEYKTCSFYAESPNQEDVMLSDFHFYINNLCGGTLPLFVGHNVGKFDLPFIWKRSVINGVKPCSGVKWIDGRHGQHHFDTMTAWAGYGNRVSLDNLCKVFGLEGKGDMDGSMVYDTWQEDPVKVLEYCHDDVRLVKEIHKRINL